MYGSRNRGNDFRDFASPDELVGHSYPNQPVPELDPKDERLLWLADKNGYLTGRNSVLEIANNELVRRVRELEEQLESTTKEGSDLRKKYENGREEYFELDREVRRLRQYEPKPAEGEENDD